MSIPKLETRSACAEKNDNIGWSWGVSRQINGRSIGLRSDDQALLQELEALAGPYGDTANLEFVNGLFSLKAGGPGKRPGLRNFFVLYDGWTKVARSLEKEPVMQEFRARWLSAVATVLFPETNITKQAVVLGTQQQAHAWVGLPAPQAERLLAKAQGEGIGVLSRTALVVNLDGVVRHFPDSADAVERPVDLDALPATRIASLTFVDSVAAPATLSPGQGALRLLGQVIGNATLKGEMVALSNALVSSHCRVLPVDAWDQHALCPEHALLS